MFSDPVIGDLFFGRAEILETLKKRVDAHRDGYRQNLALIGEERLGKTSILQQYLHTSHDARVVAVYIDLTPHTFETFVRGFCRTLLLGALDRDAASALVPASLKWDDLASQAVKVLPRTVAASQSVLALLEGGEPDRAYNAMLELPTAVFRETGKRCVVILDEFHRLGDFPVKQAFQVFGKRLMVQKDTQYILLSSSVRLSRDILAQKLALLFGHFERIDLGPFDFRTSDGFIERRLEPAVMGAPTRRFLTAITDGHPFYLNALTRQLREETERHLSGQVTRSMLLGVFKRTLFDADGILNQCFLTRLSRWTDVRSTGSYRQMLLELAEGACRIKDLAVRIGKSQAECSRRLNALIEDELVTKKGALYSLSDQLFRFWIRSVYRRRDLSVAADAPSRAGSFIQDLEAALDAFLLSDATPETQRVADLIAAFSGDRVEWDGKSRQLPVMDRVEVRRSGPELSRITASGARSKWQVLVFTRPVTEADVRAAAGEVRSTESSKPRMVIVYLDGMDPNAKLLAKNSGLWAIGLRHLNELLSLHRLDKMIRFSYERPETATPVPSVPAGA